METQDKKEIKSVDELLKEIGKLEEKAYVQGILDTLTKIQAPILQLQKGLESLSANIEATLSAEGFVNKAEEELSEKEDSLVSKD